MLRTLGHELDRTNDATTFCCEAHDPVLWASGRYVGRREVPPERRPVPGERVVYEPVRTVRIGAGRVDADEAVFAAAGD